MGSDLDHSISDQPIKLIAHEPLDLFTTSTGRAIPHTQWAFRTFGSIPSPIRLVCPNELAEKQLEAI